METKIWTLTESVDPIELPVGGNQIEFSPDEKLAFVFKLSNGLHVVDLEQRSTVMHLAKGMKYPNTCAICPSKGIAAVEISAVPKGTFGAPTILMFDLGSFVQDSKKYALPVETFPRDLQLSRDGRILACIGVRKSSTVLGVMELGKSDWKVLEMTKTMYETCLRLSDDGGLVAATNDGKLTIWDWEKDTHRTIIPSGVKAHEFAPKSHDIYFITTDPPGVRVVNADTGQSRLVGAK